MKLRIKLSLLISFLYFYGSAQLRLPALVADHMVLQRGMPIPLWGWASPGEKISILFKNKTYTAITDVAGKWSLRLGSHIAGGPFELTIKSPAKQITIKDILIGDVWICSGQSNMVFDFNNGRARSLYAKDIAASENDQIRQILVARVTSPLPNDNFKTSGWKSAKPEVLNGFSAAAYFFARDLYEKNKVAIGLINTSWGGTKAEAWISEEGIKAFPQFDKEVKLLKDTAQIAAKIKERQLLITEWHQKNKTEDKGATKAGRLPGAYNIQDLSVSIYNGMIAPLIPYGIKGAIWYQGENNSTRGTEYRTLFPAMIADWRSKWKQGDFPFIFQQLVNFKQPVQSPGESEWAELREAQSMTLSRSPNTAMAVGIDIGEADDIHPVNKLDVGRRLALAARNLAYEEKKLIASGPIYQSLKIKGGIAIVSFTSVGKGLVAKNGKALKYFAIAGADKKFFWADATITGNQIVVMSEDVPQPVAVRYAWADNPEGCNLINNDGLPASPFRTDNWERIK